MLYKKIDESKIQCLACSHYCKILKGKTGFCGVRQNSDGKLALLIYGRPSAINVDPMEKKPLYHFYPGSKVLSLGSFGCNFKCDFCQNWGISQVRGDSDFDSFESLSPMQVVELSKKKKMSSIAFTYNEPTIWSEYAIDVAKFAKKEKIKIVYVSNGYMSKECRDFIMPHLSAINIDLKSFSSEFYLRTCGAKLKPVLENIEYFSIAKKWVEVTSLLIPGVNDSRKELKKIAEFIAGTNRDIPWHLSAFHGDFKMAGHTSTKMDKLIEAYDIGKEAGLNYVYIGNVTAGKYANTYCPQCGELLIERGYMSAKIKNMHRNKCAKCGEKIAGIF